MGMILKIIVFMAMLKLLELDESPRKIAITYTIIVAIIALIFTIEFNFIPFILTLTVTFLLAYLFFFLLSRAEGITWWVTVIIGFIVFGLV